MTILSADQLIAALSAGNAYRSDFNKLNASGAQAVGGWYDLSQGSGNPSVNAIIGSTTNLAHQAVSETTSTTATTAAASGSINTTTFTDTTHNTGRFTVGMQLTGAGVVPGTYITALGTGTGANSTGTYTTNTTTNAVVSQTITGTAQAFSIPTGGNVSTSVKNLLNASMYSASPTPTPIVFVLYDMLAVYTISSVTTTGVQSFTGQTAWPRYANGVGVRAFLTPSIVMGAGTPTVQIGYTNTASVSGLLTPGTLPALVTTAAVGSIPYSGAVLAGHYGPFLPLNPGDQGILSVQNINFSATMTTGCMNLVICKPLATIPITTLGVSGERDFVNQMPSMPVIPDGACLNWLMHAGVATPANTPYFGSMDFVWG